jgi:hypothetical protein
MLKYQFRLFAIGAVATIAAVGQAAAQCCAPVVNPCCGPAVAPVVAPVGVPFVGGCCGPAVAPEMLIVNQGPVYSGPGPYVTQRNYIEGDQFAPIGYPYVGYTVSEYDGPAFRYRTGGFYRGPGYFRRWAAPPYRGYGRPPLRVYGSVAPRTPRAYARSAGPGVRVSAAHYGVR